VEQGWHGQGRLLAAFGRLLDLLAKRVEAHYGPRLVSLAVFGSVARRTPGPTSDVDLLLVVDPLPPGRTARVEEFAPVETGLADLLGELKTMGVDTRLSPVFRTPAEVRRYGGPLFLDMTEEVVILHDREGFLRGYLDRLKRRLQAGGARRVPYRGAWYWDLGSPGSRGDDGDDG